MNGDSTFIDAGNNSSCAFESDDEGDGAAPAERKKSSSADDTYSDSPVEVEFAGTRPPSDTTRASSAARASSNARSVDGNPSLTSRGNHSSTWRGNAMRRWRAVTNHCTSAREVMSLGDVSWSASSGERPRPRGTDKWRIAPRSTARDNTTP